MTNFITINLLEEHYHHIRTVPNRTSAPRGVFFTAMKSDIYIHIFGVAAVWILVGMLSSREVLAVVADLGSLRAIYCGSHSVAGIGHRTTDRSRFIFSIRYGALGNDFKGSFGKTVGCRNIKRHSNGTAGRKLLEGRLGNVGRANAGAVSDKVNLFAIVGIEDLNFLGSGRV